MNDLFITSPVNLGPDISLLPDYPADGVEKLPIQQFDSLISVDEFIHDFIISNRDSFRDTDRIFIPLSPFGNYLDFTGIRIAIHIRLTAELGLSRSLPIVMLGYESKEEVCRYSPLGHFLFTNGVYLTRESREQIDKVRTENLRGISSDKIVKQLRERIYIKPSSFYDTRHSIANAWSLLVLDKMSGLNVLAGEKHLNEFRTSLAIKWQFAKLLGGEQQASKGQPVSFDVLKDKKVLLIDDEWYKGWDTLFQALFKEKETDGASLVDYVSIKKSDEEADILEKVREKLEVDWDLFILDIRLHDNDHQPTRQFSEFLGFKVLQLIKNANKGNQVLLASASDKQWVYDYGRKIGADGLFIKPGLNQKIDTSILLSFRDEVSALCDRIFLKSVYSCYMEIENSFHLKNNYVMEDMKLFAIESEVKKELKVAADLLTSNIPNRYEYAVYALFRTLEAVKSFFVSEKDGRLFFSRTGVELAFIKYDPSSGKYSKEVKSPQIASYQYNSTKNVFSAICFQVIGLRNDSPNVHRTIFEITSKRNKLVHPRNGSTTPSINSDYFVKWFRSLELVFTAFKL